MVLFINCRSYSRSKCTRLLNVTTFDQDRLLASKQRLSTTSLSSTFILYADLSLCPDIRGISMVSKLDQIQKPPDRSCVQNAIVPRCHKKQTKTSHVFVQCLSGLVGSSSELKWSTQPSEKGSFYSTHDRVFNP